MVGGAGDPREHASPTRQALPADDFGGYRVVARLGGGGMGDVFLAEQQEPVQRQVALKVVRAGIDSAPLLLRFAAERQALARMSHDGIAKVFDAGTSRAGRPYFVMEYVPGLPITTWCDGERLGLQERLELFLVVCAAVQHAHHKGVVHRDLKSSNVLVTRQGDKAVPKIIDFGLARAVGMALTEHTLHTELGMVLGTPEYMSPEQAQGSPDVDTRADVYALGVLLYELLTGTLPFGDLGAVGPLEMQRRIVEEDPRAPSTRVAALGAAAAEPAARRGLPAQQLARRLRGDLDKIVLKTLAKEPAARYATVEALAADIRRHLRGDPVEAVPPTLPYRLRKALRRHRVPAAAALMLLAVLVGWIATHLVLYGYAEAHARAEARAHGEAAGHLARFDRLAGVVKLRHARAAWSELPAARPDTAAALERWLAEHGEPCLQVLAALRDRTSGSDPSVPDGDADRFLRDALTQLGQDLAVFARTEVAATRDSLAWARSVVARSVDAHAARWAQACADVAAAPRYGGLRLRPQLGLVPLGLDPASGLLELYDLRSAADPERLPERDSEGRLRMAADRGIVFVLLPGGEFTMGSQREAPEAPNFFASGRADESPVHRVVLAPFLLSKYELTQAQWLRLSRGGTPSGARPGTPMGHDLTNPVDNVRWHECRDLLARHGLSLPTEAQWEYACRAGADTPWYTGADPSTLAGHANLADRSSRRAVPNLNIEEWLDDGWPGSAPVGSYAANAFGLHDMLGNVFEWCRDRKGSYDAPVAAGDGERQADDEHRCLRGGAWTVPAVSARCAIRNHDAPTLRLPNLGVRPARRLE